MTAANWNFNVTWTSIVVSDLGTAVTSVALPLTAVLTLHASTLQVSLLTAAGLVSWILFGLFAGVWVDRLQRRRLLIACDTVRAIVLLSVPLAAAYHMLTLTQLVVVAFVIGVGAVFFDIGFQTYLPQVIAEDQLMAGNSKLQGSSQAAQLAGPALGGAIVNLVGAPLTLLIDAGSYLVSAGCVAGIRAMDVRPAGAETHGRMLDDIRHGLRYVWRHPVIRPLMLAAASFNLWGAGIEAVAVVFLIRDVGLTSAAAGAVLVGNGIGGVLGAFVAPALSRMMGDGRAALLAAIAGPAAALLLPLSAHGARVTCFVAGSIGLSAFTVVFSVMARVYRQTAVPAELLGRVTSVVRFVSWGVLPLGALFGGVIGQVAGNRAALWWVCTLALALTPLSLLLSPLRGAGRLRQVGTPATDEQALAALGMNQLDVNQ